MRPLRLEVEGFTCYRDRQPALDFSELTLFAIAGPTGAGKSSILDAMLYALFGEVPRIGKQGVSEFISQGRDRMSATLDFRVRDRDYRIVRASKQLKASVKTEATLAELTPAGERSIASQVKPVNEEVVRLLGLGYDEFIQTVVLPQGDFAKFLKAKPTDQRAILQHLLRHDVFARMRDLAEARRREMEADTRGLEGKLSTLQDATDEALAANVKALEEARTRQVNATLAWESADRRAQAARIGRKLTEDFERFRTQRGTLEKDQPKIERLRTELEQARHASAIVPRLEACAAATSHVAAATATHTTASKAAERALAAKTEAGTRAARASEEAKECASLSDRLQALDQIYGDVARRVQLVADSESVREQLSASETAQRVAHDATLAAQNTVAHLEARQRELVDAAKTFGLDDALLDAIESSFGSVSTARAIEQDIGSLESELARSHRERQTAERTAAEARAAYEAAQSESEAAEEAHANARTDLETGRERDRAEALRAHLHAGDTCPVCLQAIGEVPPSASAPQLAALENAVRAAESKAALAIGARDKAHKHLADLAAAHTQAVKAATAAAGKLAQKRTALATLVSELALITPAGTEVASTDLLSWLEERRKALREARADKVRHDKQVQSAESALGDARVAAIKAEGDSQRASDLHQHLQEEQNRLNTESTKVTERISAVSTASDPLAERDGLASRIEALQRTNREAEAELTEAANDAAKAEAELQAAQQAVSSANAQLQKTTDALGAALVAAGFSSSDAASTCVRSEAEQKTLASEVTTFDSAMAVLQAQLDELEPKVSGKEVSAETLAQIERETKSALEVSKQVAQAVTALELQVDRLQRDAKERASLMTKKEALQGKLATTGELATDLKGDRFQEYLLEEAFKTLVQGASVRLKEVSNRYTLEWESGEFYVVDHDNAGERRRAETLSGGETFMASLCLALQLSEEVLRTSGALQMDSLFIDEGFGTLDADSLSEVTDAMEALRQDGDRMIGVISHRPELTERLPGCIRVNKGVGESNWALERVG